MLSCFYLVPIKVTPVYPLLTCDNPGVSSQPHHQEEPCTAIYSMCSSPVLMMPIPHSTTINSFSHGDRPYSSRELHGSNMKGSSTINTTTVYLPGCCDCKHLLLLQQRTQHNLNILRDHRNTGNSPTKHALRKPSCYEQQNKKFGSRYTPIFSRIGAIIAGRVGSRRPDPSRDI